MKGANEKGAPITNQDMIRCAAVEFGVVYVIMANIAEHPEAPPWIKQAAETLLEVSSLALRFDGRRISDVANVIDEIDARLDEIERCAREKSRRPNNGQCRENKE